jgi:hypothetical protein
LLGDRPNKHGIGRKEIMETYMSTKRGRPLHCAFMVCIENITPGIARAHKIYRIIADADAAQDGDVRIVDESGEDYLYPAKWFAAVELPQRVKTSLLRRSPQRQSA